MNCFTHGGKAAVGMCALCQKGVCRECVARDAPRLVCAGCVERRESAGYSWGWYGYGFEYESATIIAGVAFGLVAVGGVSIGVLAAVGGLAVGAGVSVGGLAIGSIAVGGAAIGFSYAIGGRV